MSPKTKRIVLAGLLALSLVGCANDSSIDDTTPKQFPFVRLSPSAPPQAPYEEMATPDEPMKQIWRKGYWSYNGFEFSWEPGHYIYRPDPTAAWTPDRWEQRAFGWAFVPGYWQ